MAQSTNTLAIVIYSEKEKLHAPDQEWNFGKLVPYPEKRKRGTTIVNEIYKQGYGDMLIETQEYDISFIKAVHNSKMVDHIRSCQELGDDQAVYPHIFPYTRNRVHVETDMRSAGYFCFDVGTLILKDTFLSAKAAADVALDGAHRIMEGKQKNVFALCRPPGHHADRSVYGGYCYFNNAAIAANILAQQGKVAILDLDYHHGNGTQGIFYRIPYIYYVSIHGDPRSTYPYFTGFEDEIGEHMGEGFNLNIALPQDIDMYSYQKHLDRALTKIDAFSPEYLILSIGFDTFEQDPLGDFVLQSKDYEEIGRQMQELSIPVLAILEGGYDVDYLGINAMNFLKSFYDLD